MRVLKLYVYICVRSTVVAWLRVALGQGHVLCFGVERHDTCSGYNRSTWRTGKTYGKDLHLAMSTQDLSLLLAWPCPIPSLPDVVLHLNAYQGS